MKRKAIFAQVLLVASLLSASAGPSQTLSTYQINHLLNRIAFGPRPGDIERVQQMGVEKYIDRQLHPERIDDLSVEAKLASLDSLKMSIPDILNGYPAAGEIARQLGLRNSQDAGPQNNQTSRQQLQNYYRENGLKSPQRLLQDLQSQKIIRAVSSERQLQEVMTDFWFNHFNVFWGKGADRWLTTDYEMNAIRPHVLGKFKDLVMATAQSPAMLFYLDNAQSSAPDAQNPALARVTRRQQTRQRRPLFGGTGAIGRGQQGLADRLKKRQPGINENYARELMELHTMGVDGGYTQKDVQEVARAFTGWTIDQPRRSGRFVFRDWMHDKGEKLVLGQKVAAGGIKEGEEVIDILVHQPSTARFISTKLVRRFVSDEPPQALVDRVASVYAKTDGDIPEMLRTIFTSPEFESPDAYRQKTKSPLELVASALRALDAETDGSPRLAQNIARMGQPLYQYQPPTGFPDRASQWISSGSLIERLNFGVALAANNIPGTTVELSRFAPGTTSAEAAVDRAVEILLAGNVSSQTRSILEDQVRSSDEPALTKAFALVLGSPEFQKR
jgi:uncharacterized protein (DUF1800 family)